MVFVDPLRLFDVMHTGSYFESPYWMGIPPRSAVAVTFLQPVAVAGYLMWVGWLHSEEPRALGMLTQNVAILLLRLFLLSSSIWPFFTFLSIKNPQSVGMAILCCVPLWISAICIVLLVAFTFEAFAPPIPTLGILFLSQIVVMADGIGWSAACLQKVIHT
jgi:branched-subunit amino acid transport protein AzlD